MPNIHLSKMTGKLDGLHAISTNTVTNKFCQKMNASNKDNQICRICYSHNMLKSYRKNMQPALERNSVLLSKAILEYDDIPFYIQAFANGMDLPSNLILVYSNPTINKVMYKPPRHFHKVFNNVEYEHKTDEQNCTGQKCIDCMLCYNHNDVSVIIEATKLNGRTIKNAN